MEKCWASCLGDCDGGISGEHIVSKALFESQVVNVRGFHWCKHEFKKIGLASLTKNALCRKHNSQLSPIDLKASYAFDVLRQQTKLHNERARYPHRKHKKIVYSINASELERWLLKTLINITYGGNFFIGPDSAQVGLPSDDLVRMAFSYKKFPDKNGLFVAAKTGLNLHFTDAFHFCSLIKDKEYVCGGYFVFRGVYMFLDLVPGGLKIPFEQIPGTDSNWHNIRLIKQFRQIKVTLGKRVHQVIDFKWS